MKRWILVLLWFVTLFVWNLLANESRHPEFGFLYHCLEALSLMTTPAKILVFIVGVVVIWKQPWKRKPLAERE